MAQNITLMGASYSAVPAVTLPKTGGGTARFTDASITTAVESDVASGKIFIKSDGSQGTGTAPSPTLITKSITANGTYNASSDSADGYSSVTVNVSGGGGSGLVYETGTWTPSEDIARGEILFSNSHTKPPIYVSLVDATGTFSDVTYSNYGFYWVDWWRITGCGMYASSGTQYYCEVLFDYRGSSGTSLSNSCKRLSKDSDYSSSSISNYPHYWVDSTGFHPYTDNTSRYWRANRTYKWIAVWAPTT